MLPERGKFYWTEYEGGQWHEVVPSESDQRLGWQYDLGHNHVTIPHTVQGGTHRVLLQTAAGETILAAAVLFPDGRIYDPILNAERRRALDAECREKLAQPLGWDNLPDEPNKE